MCAEYWVRTSTSVPKIEYVLVVVYVFHLICVV